MKKIGLQLICMVFLLSAINLKAQVTKESGFVPDQFVYWIYIKAEKKMDSETKRPIYVVRTLSKTPKSGTLSVYEKEIWRYMLGGQQLAVGPFLNYEDAKRAITVYDMAKLPEEQRKLTVSNFRDTTIKADEFYWYYVKFTITKRHHNYEFDRIPARVATGTINNFLDVFLEGVTQEMLNIGPFPTATEAEESKRLNRLEED